MSDCTCGYHAPELHGPNGCTMLGCGCKWDGVLRAVVPDVKEAIAALDHLREVGTGPACCAEARVTILKLLESVARERADWLTLEEWARAKNQHDAYVVVLPKVYRATADDGVGPLREFDAPTRAEALSKAAAFCRAEMGSKT